MKEEEKNCFAESIYNSNGHISINAQLIPMKFDITIVKSSWTGK